MKKLAKFLIILAAALALSVTAACSGLSFLTGDTSGGTGTSSSGSSETGAATTVETDPEAFSEADVTVVDLDGADASVTLSGSTGTISDTTRGSSGSEVTITSKGTYLVTGSSENVRITVDDSTKSGNVYLVFRDAVMTSSAGACVFVRNADKVILYAKGSSSITSTAASETADASSGASVDGAVFSRDDLTINGDEGSSLSVSSKLHGIVCKDDLAVTGGTVSVTADGKGLDVNDSVKIGGGSLTVTSGKDGIQVSNDEGTGSFYMDGGSLGITAGYDGIDASDASGSVTVAGGTLNIKAPSGGSSKSKSSSTSQKGIKSGGPLGIGAGEITVSSADDCLHCASDINISGGTLSLSSSDDGIHSDKSLYVSGGDVTVSKAYEGLEALVIDISGGNLSITASDDGVNAAGDTSDSSTRVNVWTNTSSTGTLKISGGNIYINASGDGLDTNGSMYISGGTTIVEGPTNSGNGALDKGDGNGCVASITGGTVLALGSAGMAINFDSGTQCSALVSLSGGKGTVISVADGSGFSFTATKSFATVVYSSPSMTKGNSYKITAGSSSATASFSSSYYYSNVSGGMGGTGGTGGMGGRMW